MSDRLAQCPLHSETDRSATTIVLQLDDLLELQKLLPTLKKCNLQW